MSFNDDDIKKEFEKADKHHQVSPSSLSLTQQQQQQQQHFNITDKIIDKISDDKYLVKLSFRELMAYATPIVFNRDLEQSKIDELYTSIVEENYDIPFTIDAIYDKKAKIDEKSIKIINGNHRHGAICKYITEHDHTFSCDYKVYVWIYKVDECETTNMKRSIDLYTKINIPISVFAT